MIGIDNPQFMSSQWHKLFNSSGSAIPPYGIVQVTGMTTIPVMGLNVPAMSGTIPSADNPEKVAFTGPTGAGASGDGICHVENAGYAAHSGALDTGARYGVASGSSLLVVDTEGQFYPVGGTFISAGNNVSLFMRIPAGEGGGGGGSATCDHLRFQIVEINTSTEPYSATATVAARPCGCAEDPQEESGEVSIWDALECLLYDEDPEDYVDRKGFAKYMQVEAEDTRTTIAKNFRETSGYVTDVSPEVFANKSAWSDTADAEDNNVSNTIDRRLAGNVHPNGDDPITHTITLPAAGKYRIRLALGDNLASSTAGLVILDDATEVASISGFVAGGSFMDASGATHTAAAWPDDNVAIEEEFATTTLKIRLTGTGSKLAHFAVVKLEPCRWEITALCCLENIV